MDQIRIIMRNALKKGQVFYCIIQLNWMRVAWYDGNNIVLKYKRFLDENFLGENKNIKCGKLLPCF